ncbi:pyruvate dehydrogenase (acetyl-transferring) E1 component subunit alpha [Agaribacter marinus]|uniref:Pyruvate dehydrogenase E1 component subunit alpha n=1 Tax=Virgibacillus salarius TaxID=447199 RepID=A0A941I9W3_9BACI|nr:pyruvate dehydrogenase (acetyl-transferring) E1 component subunit alpha [Virgibacillus salarius]MBR7794731.1 pyruvate dehydrogenase (acetyl-transferring) E1 component subunit alpha [Virgibacillus salarius]NAZ07451.1 pyruvate dehydrogenase (acetyl-transferring) E1 component subunit alpha [Agaribacter marinus]
MKERYPLFQIMNKNGELLDHAYETEITVDQVKSFYYHMLRIRTYDQKGVALQRQGRIGTYVPFAGQEAAQVGSALALADKDWMFPTYRDHGASLTFGADLDRMLLHWNGRIEGCLPSREKHIMAASIPIATHLPHAAGAAMAETYKGTKNAAIAYFGDGATSEGDFHEGINIASVFKAPVVFFNQNNGFAISLPVNKQMNSQTIAQKAEAYDIPGKRVDGMDIFAVHFAVKEALERARLGEGPTLIEAVTVRFGAHTTADDPSKYRDQEEINRVREEIDPVLRLEKYMKHYNIWDGDWAATITNEIKAEIDEAIQRMESYQKPNAADMFDYVFEKPTWTIEKQKESIISTGRQN